MKTNHRLLLCAFALALCATPGRAANILWGTAQNITADTNVLNTGTQIGAFRLGGPGLASATVNGVTFQPFALADMTTTATSGNFRLNFQAGSYSSNTGFGSTSAPFSNLPAATRNLLQSGTFDGVQYDTITLTMSGLTVGQAYSFEWWINNSGNFSGVSGQQVKATGGTGAVTLIDNTSTTNPANLNGPVGGVGQFDIGTFTADTTSQVITFYSPNDAPVLNAFELRTSVPEPSTWMGGALLLLGCSALTLRQRRARRA